MPNPLTAEQIFSQACTMHGTERDAFLKGACGNDLSLRSKVDALLCADAEAGSFLREPTTRHGGDKTPVTDLDDTLPNTGSSHRNDSRTAAGRSGGEKAGEMIGRYKLLQQIGEGGFGTVWMAEQKEPVKRRVALKIIKLGMDTRQVIARFEAERQALAMMDHPNIAKVLDAGSTDTGRPYFVMELVRGVPILEYCDTEKMSTKSRLQLFMLVCHAIQHAHQKGIIHRDIKPNNVLVTMHDGRPVPKVIDFGIAKATSSELTTKTLFTEHRQMIGTPAYMSPEQAEMSGLDIDTRSDIYSLGVLLYELLTGTTPFDAKELLSQGFAEMMRIIREVEPHKPSTRLSTLGVTASRISEQRLASDPQKLGTALRGDLDWIVMKCLEKDRTRRYETANGLAADILRHLTDEPVTAGPPSTGYRLRKFIRRNRGQVAAAGVIAAALLLGVVGTGYGMYHATRERARVVEQSQRASAALRQVTDEFTEQSPFTASTQSVGPIITPDGGGEVEALARTAVNLVHRVDAARKDAQRELARANEVKRLITEMLNSVDPATAKGADNTLLRAILDNASARLADGEIDDDLVAAELHGVIGAVFESLGLYTEAERHLPASLEIHSRVLGVEDSETLKSAGRLARLYWYQSRYAEAEPILLNVLKSQSRLLGENHSDTVATRLNLANLYQSQGRYADAVTEYLKTIEIQKRIHGEEHPETIATIQNLATLYSTQGRYGEAEQLMVRALELETQVHGEDHPITLATMNNLGILYMNRGQFTEAEVLFQKTIALRERILGDEHPSTLSTIHNLANVYMKTRRYDDAEPLNTRILEIRKRTLGDEHSDTLKSMDNLAINYMLQGRYDDAEALLSTTLRTRERVLGVGHPDTLGEYTNLGVIYNATGRYADAAAMFETSLPIMRNVLGMKHPWTANTMTGLAKSYQMLNRPEDASPLLRELLELEIAVAESEDADARSLNNAAWTLLTHEVLELRDPARALRYAQRACTLEEAAQGDSLWSYLDTLALAQHSAGDSASAALTQSRAMSLLPVDHPERNDMANRLAEYEAAASAASN